MFVTKEEKIDKMKRYVTEEHLSNLHEQAFKEICLLFLEFQDNYTNQLNRRNVENVYWVGNSSMGHGKTTALACFLKILSDERLKQQRIPVLVAFKDKQLMQELLLELKKIEDRSVVMVDVDNKNEIEEHLKYFQIVLITHQRLENLALGYGQKELYTEWENYVNFKIESDDFDGYLGKRQRMLICDEKLNFVNHVSFNITGDKDNTCDWFDNLSTALPLTGYEIQNVKSFIAELVSRELANNPSSVTRKLLNDDDLQTDKVTILLNTLSLLEEERYGYDQYESLRKMSFFKKLLTQNSIGRIDDYQYSTNKGLIKGRKIIVANRIDYISGIGLNTLILDGTAHITPSQYIGFHMKEMTNYNNYSRLLIHQRSINTTKYSRTKKGFPVQKEISHDISEIRNNGLHGLFVLPMKDDFSIYMKYDAIHSEHKLYFENQNEEVSNPVNLLNTTGKNFLMNTTSIYLTNLPIFHADYYKQIAISLFGENLLLTTNNKEDQWFDDDRLEQVYNECLLAELLQIIHRTSLRKLSDKGEINIFMAFKNNISIVNKLLKSMNNEPIYKLIHLYDEDNYGLGSKVREYAQNIKVWLQGSIQNKQSTTFPCRLGDIERGNPDGIGESLRKFLKKHWSNEGKQRMIKRIFQEEGFIIYEKDDKQRTKMITLLNNLL